MLGYDPRIRTSQNCVYSDRVHSYNDRFQSVIHSIAHPLLAYAMASS